MSICMPSHSSWTLMVSRPSLHSPRASCVQSALSCYWNSLLHVQIFAWKTYWMLMHKRPGSCLIFLMLLNTLRGRTFPELVSAAPSQSQNSHRIFLLLFNAIFFPHTIFLLLFHTVFSSFKNVMLLSEESSIAIYIVMATGLLPLPKAHPQAHCAHYQTGRQHPAYR